MVLLSPSSVPCSKGACESLVAVTITASVKCIVFWFATAAFTRARSKRGEGGTGVAVGGGGRVGVGTGVAVGKGVAVGSGVGVGAGVAVGKAVGVSVGNGVGEGALQDAATNSPRAVPTSPTVSRGMALQAMVTT